jgi:hypothetical protein
VNVVAFLISRTNDNCPISLEDVLQLDLDFLARLVLVIALLFDNLMHCAYDCVFNIRCNFGPLYWVYFGHFQFLSYWSFLHYLIIKVALACYLLLNINWSR